MWIFSRGGEETIPRFTEVPMNHLSIWHIVRVIVFFQFFSIFPIASLKPGWMTLSRVVSLCIPILLITCIACCYEFFNGHYTTLKSFDAIGENIDKQDVRVRLLLFIISVITPSINFHRLQYFKEQAQLQKNLTVKELMFLSGFTSRSSFYRYFSGVEKMSPSEYIEMLTKENK